MQARVFLIEGWSDYRGAVCLKTLRERTQLFKKDTSNTFPQYPTATNHVPHGSVVHMKMLAVYQPTFDSAVFCCVLIEVLEEAVQEVVE